MTTIIAKEVNGEVHIGYDSQCTGMDAFEMEQDKVFVNNGAVYGVAGALIFATEVKHASMPAPPLDVDETDHWATTRLGPKLRQILNEISPRRHSDSYEMQILVVANNRVYEIEGNTGWVRRVSGVYTIGSGSPYASGSLDSGSSIKKALDVAAARDPYTGGRLTVTTASKMLGDTL